ncbi:hypothetical protein [Azospirillum sp. sgz301742]
MTQNTLWTPSDISNTEAGAEGGEQDSPKRRGRIPQSAWPQILERYRGGATLSAIAREFECTPSAISYIVRKAEASGVTVSEDTEKTTDTDTITPDQPAAAVPEAPVPPSARQPAARRSAEAPRPAAEAPPKPAEIARPAEPAPKTRLELKREEPRPAPTPEPVAAPVAAPTTAGEQPAATPAPRPAGARPEPTPPVDEVEARLRETARGCLAAYRTWRQQPGTGSVQSLSDAVHDLRKVLARIEIDMSASRRDEQVARPIPIPAHRAARRPQ